MGSRRGLAVISFDLTDKEDAVRISGRHFYYDLSMTSGAYHEGLVLQRSRCLVQSSPAVTARPMQAASASTAKSFSLACRPGTQSCRISRTPIATTDIAKVSSRCRE